MQKVDKKKNEPNKLTIQGVVIWIFFIAVIIFMALRIETAIAHSSRTESDKLADFYETYDSCMQESVNKDVCTLKAIEAYN